MANLGFTIRWADNTDQLKRNLQQGLDQIEVTRAAVDKLAQSIGGDKLIRGANAYAAALQKIGGEAGALGAIEKLSSSERQRGIDLLTKAIAKYDQLGRSAPSALRDLLSAAQAAERPMQALAAETAAVQRQIDRFSGQKMTSEATAIAKAIQQIGGVSKLTAEEQRQVNATLGVAIDKYRALGQDAPDVLREIYASTAAIAKPAQEVAEAGAAQQKSFTGIVSTKINGFFGDLKTQIIGTAAGFLSAQAAIGIVQGAFRALKSIIVDSSKAYAEAEAAQKRLTTALRQAGQGTPDVIAQYNALATEFQRTTVFSDDLINEMQALLVQVGGVMPSAMRDALKASTNLAAGLDIDLRTATTAVAKAAAGNTEALGRYGIKVSEVDLQARGFAAVLETVNAQFGGQAVAQIETYSGRMARLSNNWNNVQEAIGKAILTNPIIERAINKAGEAAQEAGDNADGYSDALRKAYVTSTALGGGINTVLAPALDQIIQRFERAADEANTLEAATRALANLPSPFQAMQSQQTLSVPMPRLSNLPELDKVSLAMQDVTIKGEALTASQKRVAQSALASGKSVEEATAILTRYWPEAGNASGAVDKLSEAMRKSVEEQKRAREAQEKWLDTVSETTVKLRLSVFTLSRFGAVTMPTVTSAIGANREALLQWRPALEGVETAVYDWGAAHERTTGILARAMGQLSVLPARVKTAAEAFREAGDAPSGFANALKSLDIAGLLTQAFTGGGNILGAIRAIGTKIGGKIGGAIGLSVGGPLGKQIGEGLGALAGPLIEKVSSLFRRPEWKKLQKDIGRDFGVTVSDALAQSLELDSKTFGRQAAGLLNLDQIVTAGGGFDAKNVQAFTAKLRDTFSLLQTGALTSAQATTVLDKNFQSFADHWLKNGPLISRELVEIVRLTRQAGLESKAVGDFIAQQVSGSIVPGLEAFATASKQASEKLQENRDKLADLQAQLGRASGSGDKERLRRDIAAVTDEIRTQQGVLDATRVTSQRAADALSASVAVAFSEMMQAGTPILDIAARLEPLVSGLGAQFEATGFQGGAAFDRIRGLVTLASDAIAGPALQAATGLGNALAGLSNIGQLDQATFSGLAEQIGATFSTLVSQGHDGDQVLRLLQRPLQTIYQLATDFGLAVDEGTRALLDQAQSAGVVGEAQRPVQEQMLSATLAIRDAVEGLAKVFGVDLPSQVKTGAKAMESAFKKLPRDAADAAGAITDEFSDIRIPEIRIPIAWDPSSFNTGISGMAGGVPVPELEGFAEGSSGVRDFGRGTLAVLHGREAVVPEADYRQMVAMGETTAAAPVTVNLTFHGILTDGASVRRALDEHVWPNLPSAIVRDTGGLRKALTNAAKG